MLTISGLSKDFGGLRVLNDVTFTVTGGQIFGLIGPNGAGKTTLFNVVTGLLKASSGSVELEGRHLIGMPPHRITQSGIGRTFQNIRIFKEMTLLENVLVAMHEHLNYNILSLMFRMPGQRAVERRAAEKAREILSWVRLDAKAELEAGSLSYGEQRKLELARAIATGAKLLLVDEPAAGMNPAETTELMSEIRQINQRGFTIFLIEHDMRLVMELCHEIAVLSFGELIKVGTPGEVRADQRVIEAYLGKDE